MTDELAVNATYEGAGVTVNVTKIGALVNVSVRDGVMICPQCGDELIEVSRDTEGVTYECRSDKAVMDVFRRDLLAAFDSALEQRDE